MTPLDRVLDASGDSPTWRRRLTDAAIVATPLVVGGLGGVLTAPSIRGWYRTLERPDWNPPDWVFGPVWSALYLTMGVALVQVVRSEQDRAARQVGLGLFALQLVLNFGWSWIFFVNHDLGGAVVEVLALWLAIAATIASFAAVRRSAALLLMPYLAWTSFAALLTVEVWRRNR